MILKCKICGKVFNRSYKKAGTCSHKCGAISQSMKLSGIKIPKERKIRISRTCRKNGVGKWMLGRKANPKFLKMAKNQKGANSPSWKGGKYTKNGYIFITNHNHPNVRDNGYILEHRLIVEKYLKRFITNKEVTHHVNKIRHDNRVENLMVFSGTSAHQKFHRNPLSVKPEEIIFDGRKLG